ncbi:hypothetical protein BH10ACT3_BH10ACT3_17600 [soil metagenome]
MSDIDNNSDVFRGRPSRRSGHRWPYLVAGLGSALVTIGLLGFVAGAPVAANVALIVVGVIAIGAGYRGAYQERAPRARAQSETLSTSTTTGR